jgi:hypothetical protein
MANDSQGSGRGSYGYVRSRMHNKGESIGFSDELDMGYDRRESFFFFFFVVLGLELRAYTLNHSTSPLPHPFFVMGFF